MRFAELFPEKAGEIEINRFSPESLAQLPYALELELKNKAALTKTLYKLSQQELVESRPKVLLLNLLFLPLLPSVLALLWWLIKRTVTKKLGDSGDE